MTDNATELLRKLLNERGVGYFTDDDERAYDEPARTTWDFVLCGLEMTVTATEFVDVDGKTYLEMDFHHAFTPEQAVAATLGAEYHGYEQAAIEAWESIKAWNTRATHGTLTAEQVEIAINNHCQFTVGCVVDAQAIADELNARAEMSYEDALILLDELGLPERTCCIVEYADAPIPVCSECGAVQPDDYAVYYCWSCGAKVRNE